MRDAGFWPPRPDAGTALPTAGYIRRADQDHYLGVMIEKEALSGIVGPVASWYHAPLPVNRGYMSASMLYEAARRLYANLDEGRAYHILYMGCHDPSGMDMVRGVHDRLLEFDVSLEVER